MSRGLQALDRIATRLQGLDLAAVRQHATDASWAPTIPAGHTPFSWTGKSAPANVAATAEATIRPRSESDMVNNNAAEDESGPKLSAPDPLLAQFAQLEFRVGTIVAVKRHPDADSLYVEQIDVGEASPREIVSGLVKYIPEEHMMGSRVIVFANLKPSKLRGVTSNGMVMCAANADRTTIEFVSPPIGARPGDLVALQGAVTPESFPEVNPKKKGNPWAECAPFLKTDGEGVARFQGLALVAGEHGCCCAATLKQSSIS